MVDENKLSTRRATASDYHAVMGISRGVYDGWDYLPEKYHHIIQDPNCIAMVLLLDGKVVGQNLTYQWINVNFISWSNLNEMNEIFTLKFE